MKNYLRQLIDDIRKATHKIIPPKNLWNYADVNSELELEDMAFIEKYYEGDKKAISEITGIDAAQLPAPDRLTDEQKSLLAGELEKLLIHFNFYLDFPQALPDRLKYPVIFDFWKEEHVAVSFGQNNIELCDMEKENCPFPGYCPTCDEVAAQMKYDEETCGSATDLEIDPNQLLPTPKEMGDWIDQHKEAFPDDEKASTTSQSPTDDDPVFEEMNGFYDDDGTKINPESIPVPSLCIICKMYQADDWEENLLCNMNRYDQRNDEEFECGAFKKL